MLNRARKKEVYTKIDTEIFIGSEKKTQKKRKMRGDYDLERLVYLANLEISASSTTLHSTGSCPESLRWIRKTHGLFRFANHKIENDTETQTYPVWWRRSQSTKRISTSKGVICDIICAECRNSSGKKNQSSTWSKNALKEKEVKWVPLVTSRVLEPLVAFK